ncbi:MAG: segregation/condensation protein A [Oscillospiraceae bacterium]|nr:segregation/condensation protein A [Oscillospiraceae bacterium]
METISYKLDVFEGPMDLLLHLISKHRLNIYDIPIVTLVEQYVDYVRRMQDEDMYVASEFLEMAARLVYLKSVSLLPVYAEAEELKKELQGELIEYRDMKLAAEKLSENTEGFGTFIRNPAKIDPDQTYKRLHEPEELLDAYISAAGKNLRHMPPPIEVFKDIVVKKVISVGSRITGIFKKLTRKGQKARLNSLFYDAESRSELVATFLAVLELAKSKKISVTGDGEDTQVELLSEDTSYVSEEWN